MMHGLTHRRISLLECLHFSDFLVNQQFPLSKVVLTLGARAPTGRCLKELSREAYALRGWFETMYYMCLARNI